MLKRISLFIIILFFACLSKAQTGFFIGPKAGFTVPDLKSNTNNPVSKNWSSRMGPYFGISGRYGFSQKFGVVTEVNYSSQGGKKKGTQAIATAALPFPVDIGQPLPDYVYANYNNVVKLNYLEIPVKAEFSFWQNSKFEYYLHGGFFAALLLNAKSVSSGTSKVFLDEALTQIFIDLPVTFDGSTDVSNEIRKTNWGAIGGIGLKYSLSGSSQLRLEAGGNYGFIHIQKNKANGENNTGALYVSATALFSLK